MNPPQFKSKRTVFITSLLWLLTLLTPPLTVADAKPTLTIYTYESFVSKWGPGPLVEKAFEAECSCDLRFIGLEDGAALLSRLKLEGERTSADIVLGLDTSLTKEALETGLFAPHKMNIPELGLSLPWDGAYFLPYDYGHFAIIYDTQRLNNPPHSMKALIENDEGGKLIIQDPRTSTPGLGLLLWVKSVFGTTAPQAWEKLAPRILTVTKGWSEAYGLFLKGEAPMVLSYTTSPAYHMIAEESDRYQAADFAEGHYAQIEVAGKTVNRPQSKLADDFLAFMVSPRFQDLIPTTNWMFPAGRTEKPLPEAFNKLVRPVRTLHFTPNEVATHRKEWINEWLHSMSR